MMQFIPPKQAVISAFILFFSLLVSCRNEMGNEPVKSRRDTSVLLLKGSESELSLIKFMTGEYKKKAPGFSFKIDGGGSGLGIDALIKDEIDIANSSRMITEKEISIARDIHLNPLQVIIAIDAVSIITHSKVGIDSLSVEQLSALFSGKIKNWKEVGGVDLPVVVISRNENSGTYHYLLSRLGIDAYAPGAEIEPGYAEIVNEVSRQKGAIGYVNLGSIFNTNGMPCKTVWVANIYVEGMAASSPYNFNDIRNGDYPLIRPLYQYVNEPVRTGITNFIRFELSDTIQSRLEQHGYFPITPVYKTINKKNGF